jgi:sugar fermentation stimulation protein A
MHHLEYCHELRHAQQEIRPSPMQYHTPLIEAHFLKRYKRFFADVDLSENERAVAHVPNTGSLREICDSPTRCRLLKSTDPKRKLPYTLEQVLVGKTWVGVNTHRANEFVWEAFTNQSLPHWQAYSDGAREVKISSESRLDMRLNGPQLKPHFVEIKSVTLAENSVAMFPDSETVRGQKHLRDLMKLQREGATTEIFFAVQRSDCSSFAPAHKFDSEYARLLAEALKCGVRVSVYHIELGKTASQLNFTTPLRLSF